MVRKTAVVSHKLVTVYFQIRDVTSDAYKPYISSTYSVIVTLRTSDLLTRRF